MGSLQYLLRDLSFRSPPFGAEEARAMLEPLALHPLLAGFRGRPALDVEDQTRGFGAHSDQQRILETEFQRYARFYDDIVQDVARSQP